MYFIINNPAFLPGLVFLLVTGALLLAFAMTGRYDQRMESRLRTLADPREKKQGGGRQMLASLVAKVPQASKGLLPTNDQANGRLQTKFSEAGITAAGALSIYIASKCIFAVLLPLGFIVAAWLHWMPVAYAWLGGSLTGLIGFFLPSIWLERRRSRRQSTLRRALPDFLDLIVACLGGGMSVQAALKRVAEELRLAHAELAAELLVVLKEIELGRTLDAALHQFASRTGLEELRTLCSFVHQTAKFGTTITDALGQLAEMLRIQREQRAEEMAQKAAVKILFPTLLFIFPTVFVVLAGPAAIQIQEGFKTQEQQESSPTSRK